MGLHVPGALALSTARFPIGLTLLTQHSDGEQSAAVKHPVTLALHRPARFKKKDVGGCKKVLIGYRNGFRLTGQSIIIVQSPSGIRMKIGKKVRTKGARNNQQLLESF